MNRGSIRYRRASFVEHLKVHRDNPLKLEIQHLLDATRRRRRGEAVMLAQPDDLRSLAMALEIERMIRDGVAEVDLARPRPVTSMRSLGLMCGAGPLPARMAAEARRQGWRIVAFTFPGAGEPDGWAEVVIPSRLEAMSPVLAGLAREKIAADAVLRKVLDGRSPRLGPAGCGARDDGGAGRHPARRQHRARDRGDADRPSASSSSTSAPSSATGWSPRGCVCAAHADRGGVGDVRRGLGGRPPDVGRADRPDGRRPPRRGERGGGDRGHDRDHPPRHRAERPGRRGREGRGARPRLPLRHARRSAPTRSPPRRPAAPRWWPSRPAGC